MSAYKKVLTLIISMWSVYYSAAQQTLVTPRVSQRAEVSQTIGVTKVSVIYHRPQVNEREIWGALVPFDMDANIPWRGGANENTTITFSDDIKVEGKPLKAGTYGLHFLIHRDGRATVIFSNNAASWGSFSYNQSEDALRAEVQCTEIPHHEYLTYEFSEIQPNYTVLQLRWEKKGIPLKMEVDTEAIAIRRFDEFLKSNPKEWRNYFIAANYAATIGEKEKALAWGESGLNQSGKDPEATVNLATLLYGFEQIQSGDHLMVELLNSDGATPVIAYRHGRTLVTQGRTEEALKLYEDIFRKKFPDDRYLYNLGIARVYSKKGDYKKALKLVKLALEEYKKSDNQTAIQLAALEGYVKSLESDKDFN